MAISTLVYKITADTRQFKNGIVATRRELTAARKIMQETQAPAQRYNDALGGLNRLYEKGLISAEQYKQALAKLKAEFRQAGDAAGTTGGRVSRFNAFMQRARLPMLAAAGAGAVAVKRMLSLAASAEQAQVSFETLLGSADDAKRLLQDLGRFAAATPFQIEELRNASRSLAAFGVNAEEIVPTLRRLGDVSAGINQPIGEIAEIYGKARVQGRLFMEDINQLTGRGIPVIQELAKQFGVAESEVRELVSSGQVNFANLEQAFIDLTAEGAKFGGLMQAQSETLAGSFSTLKDVGTQTLADLGVALSEGIGLTDIIQDLTTVLKRLQGIETEVDRLAPRVRSNWRTITDEVERQGRSWTQWGDNVVDSLRTRSILSPLVNLIPDMRSPRSESEEQRQRRMRGLARRQQYAAGLEAANAGARSAAAPSTSQGSTLFGPAFAATFGIQAAQEFAREANGIQAEQEFARQANKPAPGIAQGSNLFGIGFAATFGIEAAKQIADRLPKPTDYSLAVNSAVLKGSEQASKLEQKLQFGRKRQERLLDKIEKNTRRQLEVVEVSI